jgi:hypothetical protein
MRDYCFWSRWVCQRYGYLPLYLLISFAANPARTSKISESNYFEADAGNSIPFYGILAQER